MTKIDLRTILIAALGDLVQNFPGQMGAIIMRLRTGPTVLFVVALTLVSTSLASACGWCDHGPPGFDHRPGGMQNLAYAQHEVLGAMTIYWQEAGLSQEQLRAILRIRKEYRDKLILLLIKGRGVLNQLHVITEAPVNGRPIDRQAAYTLARELGDLNEDVTKAFIDALIDASSVLRPEQIKRIQDLTEEENARFPVISHGGK